MAIGVRYSRWRVKGKAQPLAARPPLPGLPPSLRLLVRARSRGLGTARGGAPGGRGRAALPHFLLFWPQSKYWHPAPPWPSGSGEPKLVNHCDLPPILAPPKVTQVTSDSPQKLHSRTGVPVEGSALLSYGRHLSLHAPRELAQHGQRGSTSSMPGCGLNLPLLSPVIPSLSHGPMCQPNPFCPDSRSDKRGAGAAMFSEGQHGGAWASVGTGFLTGTAGPWGGLESSHLPISLVLV